MIQDTTAFSGIFLLAEVLFFLVPGAVGLLRRGTGWPVVAVLGGVLGGVAALSHLSLLPVLVAWAILLLAAVLLRRNPHSK